MSGLVLPPELLGPLVDVLAEALAPRLLARLEAPARAEPAESWRLVGVDEVAAMLGRSRRWVHGAVKERGLPYVRLDGGALAFDPEDVRGWARARRVPAEGPETLAPRLHEAHQPARSAGSADARRSVKQKAGREGRA